MLLRTNTSAVLFMSSLFPFYLRLPPTDLPIWLSNADQTNSYALQLISLGTSSPYWSLSANGAAGVQFLTVSDTIVQTDILISSYSVVALYLSVVLTVGSFIRHSMANQVGRVMFEVHQLIYTCSHVTKQYATP